MNHTEDLQKPLLHKRSFVQHIGRNVAIGLSLSAISLFGGMWGYHHFEKMPWIDAYVNAAMILLGMGPVDPLKTEGGKLFAGSYALLAGSFFCSSLPLYLLLSLAVSLKNST